VIGVAGLQLRELRGHGVQACKRRVEGVHAHLHVGDVHARVVRLDADLHVEIDHPFDRDQCFHFVCPLISMPRAVSRQL
jgi:hypothetical protein